MRKAQNHKRKKSVGSGAPRDSRIFSSFKEAFPVGLKMNTHELHERLSFPQDLFIEAIHH